MIIYDIEIAKAILGPDELPDPTIMYCNGWHDHAGMGISCIAAYDYVEDRYRLFMEDNQEEFESLLLDRMGDGHYIVGFNSRNFDNCVVNACGWFMNFDLLKDHTYDPLQEIWRAVTKSEQYVNNFDWKVHAGYGLDACVKANKLSTGKTGHGSIAPIDFQRHRYGSLIDYCLADVWNTKKLLDLLISTGGQMESPKGGPLQLWIPKEVLQWQKEKE